jgi:hypothetical protein
MKRYIDLNEDYGLVPADGNLTLTTKGLTLQQAQEKFPAWWNRWNARGGNVGWTNTQIQNTFMQCGMITACANDAFFAHQAHNPAIMTGASANVVIPWGEYTTTSYIYAAIGLLKGDGTFAGGADMGSTVIKPAQGAAWNPEPDFVEGNKRLSLGTATIGTGGILGYAESVRIADLRFEGGRPSLSWNDPSYVSSGLILAGPGEGFICDNILSNSHNNYGIEVRQSTPLDLRYASVFKNKYAGIGMFNTALATMRIGVLSGDDNPYLFAMEGGATGEPGGMLTIDLVKLESDTSPGGIFGDKDQCVGLCRGQFGVNIGAISAASGNSRSFSIFVVDSRLNNGTPQSSRINVGMCKNINFDNLVVDLYNQKRWPAPTIYSNYSFTYDSDNGGVVTVDGVVIPSLPYTHNDRLGPATSGQSYDYVNYTPRWSYQGPDDQTPPTTCTWVVGAWGAWGACTNGFETRTRLVVSSVSGCIPPEPKPAETETRPCVAPPPPPTGIKGQWNMNSGTTASITAQVGPALAQSDIFLRATRLSGGTLGNTRSIMRYTTNIPGVTQLKLTGFVPANVSPNGGQFIIQETPGRGIVITAGGGIADNRSGGDVMLAPVGTVVNGVSRNLTLNFPSLNMTVFGAMAGAGNAVQFTELDAMEVA